jgi:hypothetical protein
MESLPKNGRYYQTYNFNPMTQNQFEYEKEFSAELNLRYGYVYFPEEAYWKKLE